jgi:tRNA(Ile)-lysidine synthase
MLDDFRSYVEKVAPAALDGTTLLAVSGGVDSMVMLDLYVRAGLGIVVAHVDHHTREGQSTADANWLASYCRSRDIDIVVGDYHHAEGSFQVAAREYRTDFFEKTRKERDCTYIATAHHQDDIAETLLLMLARGAGLRGLTSMQPLSGSRFKALLFADKAQILAYQLANSIDYRHDSSNDETVYQRNKIRHQVMPALESWQVHIKQHLVASHSQLSQDRVLLAALVDNVAGKAMTVEGDRTIVQRNHLQAYSASDRLLHYMTTGHKWTADQTAKMMTASTGATFSSQTHECLVDRERLLIRRLRSPRPPVCVSLEKGQVATLSGLEVANVGAKPITIRGRVAGDRVMTRGGSTKSLKRLLIDLKIDRWTKEDVLVAAVINDTDMVYPLHPPELRAKCMMIDGVGVELL